MGGQGGRGCDLTRAGGHRVPHTSKFEPRGENKELRLGVGCSEIKNVATQIGARALAAHKMDDLRQAKRNKLSCPRDRCPFTTDSLCFMKLHELRYEGTHSYSCYLDNCPYKAYTSSALKIHEMTHRGEKPHVCDICKQAFTQSGSLRRHQKMLHENARPKKMGPLLACDVDGCDFTTRRPSMMARHKKTHERSKKIRPLLACDVDGCLFTTTAPSKMARHKKPHERSKKIRPLLSCDVDGCPYTTRRPDHMERHTRRHRGERPFSCDTCTYRAFTKEELKVHQATHSLDKPFVCDFEGCEYACSQSGNLKRH